MLSDYSLLSREEVWKRFAEDIGVQYTTGDFWQKEAITARVAPWTVTLDLHQEGGALSALVYTRLRALYIPCDSFCFSLYRDGVFDNTDLPSGMPDVVTGHDRFDAGFQFCGTDETKLRTLLRNDALRDYLLSEPQIGLAAHDLSHDRSLRELTCQVIGAVQQPSRLLTLFELMAETLQHLVVIGSARG